MQSIEFLVDIALPEVSLRCAVYCAPVLEREIITAIILDASFCFSASVIPSEEFLLVSQAQVVNWTSAHGSDNISLFLFVFAGTYSLFFFASSEAFGCPVRARKPLVVHRRQPSLFETSFSIGVSCCAKNVS